MALEPALQAAHPTWSRLPSLQQEKCTCPMTLRYHRRGAPAVFNRCSAMGNSAGYSSFIIAHTTGTNPGFLGIYHEGAGATGNEPSLFTAVPQNVSLDVVYDLDANTMDVTYEDIDNPSNGMGTFQRSIDPNYAPNAFELFKNGGGVFTMGYDNLRIADVAIPEPSSLVLLSLGCVALLATRRRRQA